MIKVLACIYDLSLLQQLLRQVRDYPTVIVIALSSLPSDASVIDTFDIDVCLLEYQYDSLAVTAFINHLHRKHIELIILLSDPKQGQLKKAAALTTPAFIFSAPYQIQHILLQLIKLGRLHQKQAVADAVLEADVAKMLLQLGIPVHLNGYRFIKSAVIILYQYDGQPISMVQLYKEIARIHMTTTSRVEKAVRDAVEYAYRTEGNQLSAWKQKPTNSQVIYHIYECALPKIKKHKMGGE